MSCIAFLPPVIKLSWHKIAHTTTPKLGIRNETGTGGTPSLWGATLALVAGQSRKIVQPAPTAARQGNGISAHNLQYRVVVRRMPQAPPSPTSAGSVVNAPK